SLGERLLPLGARRHVDRLDRVDAEGLDDGVEALVGGKGRSRHSRRKPGPGGAPPGPKVPPRMGERPSPWMREIEIRAKVWASTEGWLGFRPVEPASGPSATEGRRAARTSSDKSLEGIGRHGETRADQEADDDETQIRPPSPRPGPP